MLSVYCLYVLYIYYVVTYNEDVMVKIGFTYHNRYSSLIIN
jgi:hypothetical protein